MHDRVFDFDESDDYAAVLEALETYRLRWENERNPRILVSAMRYLHDVQQPLPWWLVEAVGSLRPQPSEDRHFWEMLSSAMLHYHDMRQPPPRWLMGAVASLQLLPSKADVRDWLRWFWVRDGINLGTKWKNDALYKYAAEQCAQYNNDHISADTVKYSYDKVQHALGNPQWDRTVLRGPGAVQRALDKSHYAQPVIRQDRGHLRRSIVIDGVTVAKAGAPVMVEYRHDDGTLELRTIIEGIEGTLFRAREDDVQLDAEVFRVKPPPPSLT